RGQVQICVSALRRALAGAGLENPLHTHQSGYLLRIPDEQLDATVFDRLGSDARALANGPHQAQAARELHQALALWRGPARAAPPGRVVEAGRKRLEEHRLAAMEERIRLDLALGRHAELIGELFGLVAEHPVRERLHAQLMLALYRAGRQAEALEAYRRA